VPGIPAQPASRAGLFRPQAAALPSFAPDLFRRQADEALGRGDTQEALRLVDRAEGLAHLADVEIAGVQALMQAGAYRQALAFAAHVSGVHRESAEGTALYAALLHAGAQEAAARRVVETGWQRHPGHALLAALRVRLGAPVAGADADGAPDATGVPSTLAAPQDQRAMRAHGAAALRPSMHGDTPTASVRSAGGALRVGARHAVMPWPGLTAPALGGMLWLRDGRGLTRSARLVGHAAGLGLALVEATRPFDAQPVSRLDEGHAHPGSPAYMAAYEAGRNEPGWPVMRVGFLGGLQAGGPERWLGFGDAWGHQGGPVFDAQGRLIGLTLAAANGRARFLPRSAWQPWLAQALAEPPEGALPAPPAVRPVEASAPASAAGLPGASPLAPSTAASGSADTLPPVAPRRPLVAAPDRVYESALREALLVLVADPAAAPAAVAAPRVGAAEGAVAGASGAAMRPAPLPQR
jgi:hypothetical protein